MRMKMQQKRTIIYIVSLPSEIERFSNACLRLRVPYSIKFYEKGEEGFDGVEFRCLLTSSEEKELDELYDKINGEMAS